jgi:hypothetical protein
VFLSQILDAGDESGFFVYTAKVIITIDKTKNI